jgi:hypothetical protein
VWYRIAAQGIIQHQVSDGEIDNLVDKSLIDTGPTYLINQFSLRNGLLDLFPSLNNVIFQSLSDEFGLYNITTQELILEDEITKEDLGLFKTNLHHELQHVADPNLKRNPEDINKIADDATLALIIDIQEVDEDTVFPTYEETINKIFIKYMNRRPSEYDTPFLDKIKNKYPEEQFNDVINRIKSGDHPYYNSPIEKAANLKDFRRIFSVSNLLGIKDLISKKPSYTMEKHIKVISDILRSPSSDKFKAVLGLLEIKYPEAEQTMNPLFILNANTNPKYALQFKKQLGNIINELQEHLKEN